MYQVDDTIAAIASAAGGGGRGILRLSGPRVVHVLAATFMPSSGETLADVRVPRRLPGNLSLDGPFVRRLELPAELYFWPGPRSYTRQPVGELHTFGSPPLLAAALRALCAAGARPAEPGEFTLRAFLAGRLDLTQAEAVLGIIDAVGRRDFDAALAQLAGGLTGPLHALRERLLNLLAHLEAGLDFVEDDIEFIAHHELDQQLTAAATEVAGLVDRVGQRTSAVDLPRIVLLGSPNVGKSSLFNALTGTAGAIVANQPGTTRDFVSARIDLAGCPCELIDTAGVETAMAASLEPVRAAAQRFTSAARDRADVRIFCLDASRPINPWERDELAALRDAASAQSGSSPPGAIVVVTKLDAAPADAIAGAAPAPAANSLAGLVPDAIGTSAKTGAGLVRLRTELRGRVLALMRPDGGVMLPTAERAGASLRCCAESLARAQAVHRSAGGEELVAAELRCALDELGKVAGTVYTDDILDRVFSRFCIGK